MRAGLRRAVGKERLVFSLPKDDCRSALGVVKAFLYLLRSLALELDIPHSDFAILRRLLIS